MLRDVFKHTRAGMHECPLGTATCESRHCAVLSTLEPGHVIRQKGLHPDANTSTTAELPAPKKPSSALCSAPQRPPFPPPHPPRCVCVCAAFSRVAETISGADAGAPVSHPQMRFGAGRRGNKKEKNVVVWFRAAGGSCELRRTLHFHPRLRALPCGGLESDRKVAARICKWTAWQRGRLGMSETCCGREGD